MVGGKFHYNLFKELLRTLRKEWKQLFSIIAISFLAVCLFSGLTSNATNLKDRQDKVYSSSNIADIYINTTGYDENDFEFLTNDLEDSKVEKRMNLLAGDQKSSLKGDAITLVVADDNPNISIPIITSGEEGCLIMNKYAETYKLSIGNILDLSLPNYFKGTDLSSYLSSCLKDNKEDILSFDDITFSFEVTGTMYHAEGVQNSTFSSPLVYLNKDTLKQAIVDVVIENYNISEDFVSLYLDNMILPQLFNQYLVKTTNSEKTLELIKNYFNKKENNNLLIAMGKEFLPSYQSLKQDVDQAKQLTFVFPLIFFLVSVLVIMTTLSQMILKQRNQIGCLKALGVKKSNIYLHYMGYGVLLCFIGGLLGFFVGPLLIPSVLNLKYNILWDLPKVAVRFLNLNSILILFGMCLIAAICSFFASHSIIKEKPVDILRPKVQQIKNKESNPHSFINKHFSLSSRMAGRNIKMNKGKSLMVIIGTLGCSALLVCGFGIMDTINHCIKVDYEINQHIELFYQGSDIKGLETEYEEIERIENVYTYPINIAGESYQTTTLTLIEKKTNYFTPLCNENGVTVDQTTASKINVKVGDEIKLVIQGKTITKTVNNIFRSSVLHGVFDLEEEYSSEIKTNYSQYIYLKDKASIKNFKERLIKEQGLEGLSTLDDIKEKADDVMSSIKMMTNVVKIFAILLCIVVIYNLTSLNISKMSRDIATMKVLGFTYHEISGTLTKEIMVDTTIGTSLGLCCGFPMTVLVMMVNKTELLTFLYHVGWLSFVLAFVIAFGTALVVSLLLNLKSKRIKMVESLKSVE